MQVLLDHLTLLTSETLFYLRQERAQRTEHDKSFILTFFDIFKHRRGAGTVDKIKKYHRDISRGFLPTLAVDSHQSRRLRWLSTAKVFLIILFSVVDDTKYAKSGIICKGNMHNEKNVNTLLHVLKRSLATFQMWHLASKFRYW